MTALNDLLTQAEAREVSCPIARTFADCESHDGKCRAGRCIFWRFRHVTDGRFRSAVAREEAAIKEEKEAEGRKQGDAHKKAVHRVSMAPWRYMVPTDEDRGYCGMAGKPGTF